MSRIFILSDGTGKTAEQMINAALTQFPDEHVDIQLWPYVKSTKDVQNIIEKASGLKAFIAHTVVSDELRTAIEDNGKLYSVETIDLMGPLMAQLAQMFDTTPFNKPGLFRELNKSYFKRIEAVEFAFRHDDGLRVDEINNAEIVLLGVSRTFKTPLSIYLAFKGWLVANIPIIMDVSLPEELYAIPPERVFGLTTDANRLAVLRKSRDEYLGGHTGAYAQIVHIRKELEYAQRFYNQHPGWTILNVTNKPIEEIASEILSALKQRNRNKL